MADLTDTQVAYILAHCEDAGRCEHREGPDGWCDSCVVLHLSPPTSEEARDV